MTDPAFALALEARAGPLGLEHALLEAEKLLLAAESHAVMLAELGHIELPPASRVQPVQMGVIASLYLASTLEAAGLIEAADDITRLVRSGAIPGDLGDAAPLIADFWEQRNDRMSTAERLAFFCRLFGAPAGPVDAMGGVNSQFEELLLDLCSAIMDAVESRSSRRVRSAGLRLAENLAGVTNDMTRRMAGDIIGSLQTAVTILNHPKLRAALMARTLWDAVAAIDRRFRRPVRPTLSHLRRGRAGMVVLAWLADVLDRLEQGTGSLLTSGDGVVGAAIDWIDESLSVIRAEEEAQSGGIGMPGASRSTVPDWSSGFNLAR